MGEQNQTSWLTSAAPLIGAGLDFMSGVGSGLFNINQARKNRAFQERMYEKQVQDNIAMWKMNNEYNLPRNVIARLEEAGINPLLYFQGGSSALTSSNVAASGNAPSGDSARGDFRTQFGQAALQAAMLRAQIRNMNADSEQKETAADQNRANTENVQFDVMFKRLCKDVDIAIKHGELGQIEAATNNLVMNTLSTSETTFQTIQTMRQSREYEIKRYNLDFNTIGTQLQQGWKTIANDTERVKQGWKDLAIKWQLMQNEVRWTNEQIGALRWNVLRDRAMFLPQFESLSLDNKLKRWDINLKKADFTEKGVQIMNGLLKNYYLQNVGQEQVNDAVFNFSRGLWQGSHKPTLQDLLVLPKLK